LAATIESYKDLGKENILVVPIGKKISQAVKKMGFPIENNFDSLSDKPDYKTAQELADNLMEMFRSQKVDKVEIIYHQFKSRSSQLLINDTILPVSLDLREEKHSGLQQIYIVEPDRKVIMTDLIPKVIQLKLYTALLDSNASEHAARTIAMQIATDNADDLLQELNLQYNKSRQQAITNELLDIIGGSFGQN
jgi:F-type H+-transporting ATPase subunit gamma